MMVALIQEYNDLPLDEVIHGEALVVLKTLPSHCVDALVCDPPAGISFMNKAFDHNRGGRTQWIVWLAEVMSEAMCCLKPGGHALVWALPRTSHWTATALEDAGFEIRDKIYHHFGSGFPKSHNISVGIGTALKPSTEEWILCRKPLEQGLTIAENVLKWGTGGLNIDASRVEGHTYTQEEWNAKNLSRTTGNTFGIHKPSTNPVPSGRWPANLLLSHSIFCTDEQCDPSCPVKVLDEQSGIRSKGGWPVQDGSIGYHGKGQGHSRPERIEGKSGGASRFFQQFHPDPFIYAPKASRRDRSSNGATNNIHPTCKSQSLMKYLCILITPPGGIVLDCFAGSGSTLVAALSCGFHFIGIEQSNTTEEPYVDICRARIAATLKG